MTENRTRALWEIAVEIMREWHNPYFGAMPYIQAMRSLDGMYGMDDMYGMDSADDVVRYFLANAGTWRGETARRVKAELKGMLS